MLGHGVNSASITSRYAHLANTELARASDAVAERLKLLRQVELAGTALTEVSGMTPKSAALGPMAPSPAAPQQRLDEQLRLKRAIEVRLHELPLRPGALPGVAAD